MSVQRDAAVYGGFLDKRPAEMVSEKTEIKRKRRTEAPEERLR